MEGKRLMVSDQDAGSVPLFPQRLKDFRCLCAAAAEHKSFPDTPEGLWELVGADYTIPT